MSTDDAGLRVSDYLAHMLEAARLAGEYVHGFSKADFLQDRRTQQAVVLNLITIGEAAGRIANECKEFATAHPFRGRRCGACATVWRTATSTSI